GWSADRVARVGGRRAGVRAADRVRSRAWGGGVRGRGDWFVWRLVDTGAARGRVQCVRGRPAGAAQPSWQERPDRRRAGGAPAAQRTAAAAAAARRGAAATAVAAR